VSEFISYLKILNCYLLLSRKKNSQMTVDAQSEVGFCGRSLGVIAG
jgi:hypothetical protein